jgi:hypothetical protein
VTARNFVREAPFVRLDEQRVGLVARDIPGGPQAVAAAIETIVRALNETERGLTPHQATELVNATSSVHAGWSRELVVSVVRNEPRIRIDRSKNIGLDEWDDVRCPARAEFMRREVQKAGGSLPLRELTERMSSVYGNAPDRSSLGVLAAEVGLTIAGDVVSRPKSDVPEAPASRAAINLTGIPTELREMFGELVKQPLSSPAELRKQIEQHVADIEKEHHVNEFVDLAGARLLGQQCDLLLQRLDSLSVSEQHLVQAAVRYFVSWHDLEHDLDIGGLDDDKQIINAVLSHLGLGDGDRAALAS